MSTLYLKVDEKAVEITRLRDRVWLLGNALKPFADHAKDRCADDPMWKDKDSVSIWVDIGELRAVLHALSKATPSP
jgi:hypothetical protein